MDDTTLRTKRLPFKPTALGKASLAKAEKTTADDDGLSLFKRSKEMLPLVALEQEKRIRRKAAEEERQKRRSLTAEKRSGEEFQVGDGELHQKRRRVSSGSRDTANLGRVASDPSTKLATPPSSKDRTTQNSHVRLSETPTKIKPSPAKRRSTEVASTQNVPATAAEVITLDSDGESPAHQLPPGRFKENAAVQTWLQSTIGTSDPNLVALDDDDDASTTAPVVSHKPSEEDPDPELQKYIERARERLRGKRQSAEDFDSGASGAEPKKRDAAQVLIQSTIPGTIADDKLPAFKAFLDNGLKVLRESWCQFQRNNGVHLVDGDVFLTWRGNRLYNTTSLQSLGIQVMEDGRLYSKDTHNREGFTNKRRRVLLEAWTEPLYEEHLRDKERQRLKDMGQLDDDDDNKDHAPPPEPTEPKKRLLLRLSETESVKLSATGDTPFSLLVDAFRKKRGISADKEIHIYFDGERIDPATTVDGADVDDMDTLDVHVKSG